MAVLRTDLRAGEQVRIGQTLVTLEHKSGRTARLSIVTEGDVPIQKIACADSQKPEDDGKLSDSYIENAVIIR
jgi:hypothetical protein